LDSDVTHVVCNPKSRTLKTLSALVTCQWVVTADWPEEDYGVRYSKKPLANKKFCVVKSFQDDMANTLEMEFLRILITEKGDGEILSEERGREADYVIVQNYKRKFANSLVWNDFIQLITKERDNFTNKTTKQTKLPIREQARKETFSSNKTKKRKDSPSSKYETKTPERPIKKRKLYDEDDDKKRLPNQDSDKDITLRPKSPKEIQ